MAHSNFRAGQVLSSGKKLLTVNKIGNAYEYLYHIESYFGYLLIELTQNPHDAPLTVTLLYWFFNEFSALTEV